MKGKETLVLIISRKTISPEVVPVLKFIIPMLQLVGPLQVISSNNQPFEKPIYENLVNYLSNQGIAYPLQYIIEKLLINKRNQKFRICVIGEEDVSWKLILSCKRNRVVVDVAGKNAYLPFWTGGIQRQLVQRDLLSAFIQDFAVDSELRKIVSTSKSKGIDFSVNCICCDKKQVQAYLCSACLAVYCAQNRKTITQCKVCGEVFDSVP